MLSLTCATHTDIAQLQQLMRLVFDDDQSFLEALFSLKFNDNVLIYKERKIIAAMAFLLPAHIRIEGNLLPITYIYACATHPNYRNQGLMSSLVDKIWQVACTRHEVGVFLRPASDSLFRYYEKQGFYTFFCGNKQILDLEPYKNLPNRYILSSLSAADYYFWRTQFSLFCPDNYVIHWDIEHLELVAAHPEFGEAGYYAFRENGQTVAIACIQHDALHIDVAELLLCTDDVHFESIYQSMSQNFNTKNITLFTCGQAIPIGMIKTNPTFVLPIEPLGYMALGIE
ncbi:MAG: GNAT family N-acetyltransferase [Bacteroidales bacterium]|jgi:ribosomal protein S18 acetylase RimI-like enzyme|nr:GNAT family N-acetyltransferase [Bacteroidales bacterium]